GAKPGEDTEDQANAAPDVETRIVTLERGDTLAGSMEDVGVSSADANAVILALGKDFDPRALKAGMNFELTYAVAPDAPAKPPKTTVILVNNKPATVRVDAAPDDKDATPEGSQAISRLLSLHFSPRIDQDITVTRTPDGTFSARTVQKQLQV